MTYPLAMLALASVALGAPSGPPVDGYALYRYAPPGWHWLLAPSPKPVARAAVKPDGTCRISFSIPVSAMPGFVAAKARFGLADGFVANGPTKWLKVGEQYRRSGPPSPLGGWVFAQSQVVWAKAFVDGDVLQADLVFDSVPSLETAWDLMGLIDADGDPKTGYHGAEWLLQSCPLGSKPPPGLKVPWLVAQPGIVVKGRPLKLTAWVCNDGPDLIRDIAVKLVGPDGVRSEKPFDLRKDEARRLTWTVRSSKLGPLPLRLQVASPKRSLQKTRWVTVVGRLDLRHEFETQTGNWLLFPDRPTLQEGNAAALSAIHPLPSAKLKHNLFGITAHLPRSVNDEDPFIPEHAIDGDPATCWASRWWRIAVPFKPEWLKVDMGKTVEARAVRFLPARGKAGLPADFTVEVSADGKTWVTVASELDYHARPGGWQSFDFAPRRVRYARFTATRLNQGGTSFFCAPFEPFQFRIAEVDVVDQGGADLRPVGATASTKNNAWYNTPESVTKTWPLELASGVKLNRIGQWGDRTDWAAVERKRGVYKIPAEVDRAITQSHKAGVEILLTLAYGNNLYQRVKHPQNLAQTWTRGHPFLQCAPTTPEAVAAFARYCGFMARHFRGRVKYFEIWNEENGWFFDDWTKGGSVEEVRAYGRALKAAAQAVKKADPDAIIVFGGTAGVSFDYARLALAEGAGPWIDVFAFHPYGHPTPEGVPDNFLTRVGDNMEWKPRPPGIPDYEAEITAMRRMLHKYNPRMQVWADEMNWFAPGEPPMPSLGDHSELTQAKLLSRFYVMNAWMGCGAIWWSLYNANGVQEWAVVRSSDMTPRAAYYAAQYTSTVMDDVRAAPDIRAAVVGKAPADLYVKAFRNGKGEVLIALWRTSFPEDGRRPVAVTVRVPGVKARRGELFDLVYGVRQPARMRRDEDGVTLPGVLVGDWPVVARLAG